MKCPSHRISSPVSEPDNTLPSGSSAKALTSDRSTRPNLPISPCNFIPVNVLAMRQNRMCPMPEDVSLPGMKGWNCTVYTSWLKALLRKCSFSSRHRHTVSVKSGAAPTDASSSPSSENARSVNCTSVPPAKTLVTARSDRRYTRMRGWPPRPPSARNSPLG